ncbi:alpha-tocopherol transfer protein-like [Diachasma alloeum]|uniref:alpha-tocopherol transfer protein-like n=1 Tax=Diachasma alloeum TaxID=454923 RepID=UPI000738153E|nr:alpha-tocopherol transfer protein-like [Diachasma alloeum]
MYAKKNIVSSGFRERILEKSKKVQPLKIGAATFHIEAQELTPELSAKARDELRETPEVVEQALAEMRELLKGEPDLNVPDDDYFFCKFLRPVKWHVKPAFELMKRFYRYKVTHPRICNNLIPSSDRAIFESGVVTPLPVRADGCRVILIESGKRWKPKEIALEQIFRGVMMFLAAALNEPMTQVCGVQVILDMDGLSLSHVTYFTPSFASAVLEWVQKCLPVRLKGVHIINQPYIFNMVFAIFKPFLHEKLRKRVHFHGTNRPALLSHIEAKALPRRYGGDLDIPADPIGEPLFKYLTLWEDEFVDEDRIGYTTKK